MATDDDGVELIERVSIDLSANPYDAKVAGSDIREDPSKQDVGEADRREIEAWLCLVRPTRNMLYHARACHIFRPFFL
jgi:hypothetical protein